MFLVIVELAFITNVLYIYNTISTTGNTMGLFDRKKKKAEDDDDLDTPASRATAAEMYNKKLETQKEQIYWNTGVCWKCGQTMEPNSEYCWECGTKYKVKK